MKLDSRLVNVYQATYGNQKKTACNDGKSQDNANDQEQRFDCFAIKLLPEWIFVSILLRLSHSSGDCAGTLGCRNPPNSGQFEVTMSEKPADQDARLSRIETSWSIVRRAHHSDSSAASPAQHFLLEQYGGAIRRYLLAAVKRPDVANDLFQEFAIKFLRGDFKTADPSKGKFRSFVKTVLFRMVATHFRKLGSRKVINVGEVPEKEHLDPSQYEDDEAFIQAWRNDVLENTWNSLETVESEGGPQYNTVLRARVGNPVADSDELAAIVSKETGREISSGNVRVLVHRSRDSFAALMMKNIANSLENPTREAVENELIELRLIDYCREQLSSYQDL